MPFGFVKSHHYRVFNRDSYIVEVQLAIGRSIECTLNADSTGQECLDNIVIRMEINQPEFFGLYLITNNLYGIYWVDLKSSLKKQLNKLKYSSLTLYFSVQFFVSDISIISDEITRYHYYHCIKSILKSDKMYCSQEEAALLASYCLQAEDGDFNEYIETDEYLKSLHLFPPKLLEDSETMLDDLVRETKLLHQQIIGLSNQEAALHFLRKTQLVENYGIQFFPVQDLKGFNCQIASSHNGICMKFSNTKNSIINIKWADVFGFLQVKKKFGIIIKLCEKTYFFLTQEVLHAKYLDRIFTLQMEFFKNNPTQNSQSNIKQHETINTDVSRPVFIDNKTDMLDDQSPIEDYLKAVNESVITTIINDEVDNSKESNEFSNQVQIPNIMNPQIRYTKSLNIAANNNGVYFDPQNNYYHDLRAGPHLSDDANRGMKGVDQSQLGVIYGKMNAAVMSNLELSKHTSNHEWFNGSGRNGVTDNPIDNERVRQVNLNQLRRDHPNRIHSMQNLNIVSPLSFKNKEETVNMQFIENGHLPPVNFIPDYKQTPSYNEIISKRSNLMLNNIQYSNVPNSNNNAQYVLHSNSNNYRAYNPAPPTNAQLQYSQTPQTNTLVSYPYPCFAQVATSVPVSANMNVRSHRQNIQDDTYANNDSRMYYQKEVNGRQYVVREADSIYDGRLVNAALFSKQVDRSKSLVSPSHRQDVAVQHSNSSCQAASNRVNRLRPCLCISSPDLSDIPISYSVSPSPALRPNHLSIAPASKLEYLDVKLGSEQANISEANNFNMYFGGVNVGYCSSPTEPKKFIEADENGVIINSNVVADNTDLPYQLNQEYIDKMQLYADESYLVKNYSHNANHSNSSDIYYDYQPPAYFDQATGNQLTRQDYRYFNSGYQTGNASEDFPHNVIALRQDVLAQMSINNDYVVQQKSSNHVSEINSLNSLSIPENVVEESVNGVVAEESRRGNSMKSLLRDTPISGKSKTDQDVKSLVSGRSSTSNRSYMSCLSNEQPVVNGNIEKMCDNASWKSDLEKKFEESFIFAEFEQVHKKRLRCDFSTAMQNPKLNKFSDIQPYEDNRVCLRPSKSNPDGYINASWIRLAMPIEGSQKPIQSPLEYVIASQGPTEATVVDFWRMIWQTNCHVIAGLVVPEDESPSIAATPKTDRASHCFPSSLSLPKNIPGNQNQLPNGSSTPKLENNYAHSSNYSKKMSCYRYWPANVDSVLTFAEFEITLRQERAYEKNSYITRLLAVRCINAGVGNKVDDSHKKKEEKGNHIGGSKVGETMQFEERLIWQLQYTNWPENSCPEDAGNFLSYLETLESLIRSTTQVPKLATSQVNKHHSPFAKFMQKTPSSKTKINSLKKLSGHTHPFDSPAVVHCTAGVGRTGVVILTLLAKKMLEDRSVGSNVDLNNLLRILRDQRMCLVQTVTQYMFVNKVLAIYLKSLRLI